VIFKMEKNQKINWEEMILEYRSSGMGLDKWCGQNNVSKHSMRYHLYAKKGNHHQNEKCEVPKLMEVNFDECLIQPSTIIKLGKLEIAVDSQNIEIVSQLLKKVIYD